MCQTRWGCDQITLVRVCRSGGCGLIDVLTFFQDTITFEDARFRDYLEANGYDTTEMGTQQPKRVSKYVSDAVGL
jgi:hypothetical protein